MSTATKNLTGHLRASDAAALRSDLMQALAEGDLFIDTSATTELDCSILQVLLSARQTALLQGHTLYITAPIGGALATLLARLALPADSLSIA
jgi:anti-anti-sigma regulatory factor